ncbi:hypothetical protein BaRGS_00030014 [Batillaria attramentaria]
MAATLLRTDSDGGGLVAVTIKVSIFTTKLSSRRDQRLISWRGQSMSEGQRAGCLGHVKCHKVANPLTVHRCGGRREAFVDLKKFLAAPEQQ